MDREYLSFALVKAPEWLRIDPQTPELSGTPSADMTGKHEVIVRVTSSKGQTTESKLFIEVAAR